MPQKIGNGALTMPETFFRQAVYCRKNPVGMKVTFSNELLLISTAAAFSAARSGAAYQSAMPACTLSDFGQPNHAPLPLASRAVYGAGLMQSAPACQEWKMFQPPLPTGSFLARRVPTVPQSAA